ncbi:uncharacterized protein EAF01_010866 [Botrytis porri]|uniref:uncharacterized protein n=1 Tax=Botrytis porri TaxID=87229 RepID=UPI001900A976|nr:uncharacterized protein EAF01_010866 [Botrytis porri]KAF7889373.1 hypothetical protein EAF01_010866 [Botrytis porri]
MDPPVSIDALRAMLNDNIYIRWAGVIPGSPGDCSVYITNRIGHKRLLRVNVNLGDQYVYHPTIENHDPDFVANPEGPSCRGPRITDEQWASVLGVNVGGACFPGGGRIPIPVEGCACGYDIEVDISDLKGSQFPLPDAQTRILSIALWCSCGFKWLCSTKKAKDHDVVHAENNTELVSLFIHAVQHHMPLWLVGWNCFGFDNLCIEASASSEHRAMFRKTGIRGPAGNKPVYTIEIPGVYNVDLFVYLDRTRRGTFPSLKLGDVAKQLGAPLKSSMPTMVSDDDINEMLEYNMNDSMVTVKIWEITGVAAEVLSLADVRNPRGIIVHKRKQVL